ncbi:hypothetical protein DRX19_29025 [Salmonella enterica subsp. enterica]|nr:hypothetical protein [Salmonella enterica subsp. enterica serovar Pensacola]EKN9156107.1 hypothetical protein [Salmonella enterica]
MPVTAVHISTISAGDTVLHQGKLRTVCRRDIKNSDFFGLMLFGDSYNLGAVPVKKVIFPDSQVVFARLP